MPWLRSFEVEDRLHGRAPEPRELVEREEELPPV
jgi:hypothetical protein